MPASTTLASIMSATCHAKCPLICLCHRRNLHFICTTCDPVELPGCSSCFCLLSACSLSAPACSCSCSHCFLPLRIQFFIFMRRLECPPASGINAPRLYPPVLPLLLLISGWRLSFDLCLASLLTLFIPRSSLFRLFAQVFTSDLPCCLVL